MHPPVRKLPPVAVGMVLALAALVVFVPSALAGNGGIAPVTPKSTNAHDITDAWWFVTGFILAVFVGVEGLLIVFVARYRRGRRQRYADGPQIHGATRLETMWTLIPVLILVAVATFVFVKLPGIKNGPSAVAAPAQVTIDVRGQQFYWQYTYPNGAVSIDRLRVPVDESVLLNVTAPDFDVIHSWWIPALGGKIDAIPGRMNHTWFKATKTGVFGGRCAELCGVQHAVMLMSVEVMPRDAYGQWVSQRLREQQSGAAMRTLGQEEWTGVCAKCHGLTGMGLVGGPIASSATLQDEASLANVLRNGFTRSGATMPPVGREWSQQQIDALSAYVKERFGSQS
jgi:cytochrome c oxidase subunit II